MNPQVIPVESPRRISLVFVPEKQKIETQLTQTIKYINIQYEYTQEALSILLKRNRIRNDGKSIE